MRPLVGAAAPRPPLATPLALCYRTVVSPVLSVCEPGVLWPNGWMDQDETWHAGRPPLPWPQCVRWRPTSPPQRGTAAQFSAHICCGKMAGWIKMPLGMEVGFGPGDCVRWGPSSPKKGHSPPFSAHVYCGQTAVCIRIPLGTEEGLSLGDIVLDGDSAPPRKGAQQPPPRLAHVY